MDAVIGSATNGTATNGTATNGTATNGTATNGEGGEVGGSGTSEADSSNRIWTIPNLLSFLRLLGVPLFLWLLLTQPPHDGWALVVLAVSAVSAVTDWADGKLARLLGQYSRLGEPLDPAADRGYQALPVHYLDKAATFCLLYAFPLLLLAQGGSTLAHVAQPFGIAFTIWGMLLYLWAGALYVGQVGWVVRHTPPAPTGRPAVRG